MVLRSLTAGLVCVIAASQTAPGQNVTGFVVSAQGQGVIGGHVRDATSKPMSGVAVTTTPVRGGLARHVTTDREGAYRVEGLPDDSYRVDFELRGFDLTRRNVGVRAGLAAQVDAVLAVSAICECIASGLSTELPPVVGRVVDDSGRPVPYARLDLVNPRRRETAYANSEGRFLVRPPVTGTWPLTGSASGFGSVTEQISRTTTSPIVLRLRFVESQRLPDTEQYRVGCLCSEFFQQEAR